MRQPERCLPAQRPGGVARQGQALSGALYLERPGGGSTSGAPGPLEFGWPREMYPEPKGVVVVVCPERDRVWVPAPKLVVVAEVPWLERLISPEPKGMVVTVSPAGPRVIEPLPKLEVVYVFPSGARVIHPLPNFSVR